MSLDQAVIEVTTRNTTGKGEARKLRATGLIPAVVYGKGKEPQGLALQPEALRRALKTAHGLNTVLTLNVDGGKAKRVALLKDWESEVTTSRLLHADFIEISLDKPIRVKVPVHILGKAKGVIDGGILEVVRHVLEVDSLPANIPTSIEIDVTEMGVGDAIHLHDLKLPEGVKAASAGNFSIVSVVAPRAEKEETPVAAAAEGAAAGAAPAAGAAAAAPAAGAKGAAPAAAAGKAAPAKK